MAKIFNSDDLINLSRYAALVFGSYSGFIGNTSTFHTENISSVKRLLLLGFVIALSAYLTLTLNDNIFIMNIGFYFLGYALN